MRCALVTLALGLVAAMQAGCGMASAGENRALYEEQTIIPESTAAGEVIRDAERARAISEVQPLTAARSPAAYLSVDAPATKPAEQRLVIYSAGYRLVVADVAGTLRSLQQSAESLGGYMQAIGGSTITFRVPSAKFGDACKRVEEAGEVVDRQVQAADVTEEMRDLTIRLDNAEKLRQRLLQLLEKADKVEDTIKIEAELTRVVEQIEQAKGKIRYLSSQIAMSTIRVELNSPVPQNAAGTGPRLPFAWIENLGDGLVAGLVQQKTHKLGFFASGPRFEPPEGFVRYYEQRNEAEAMSADGLRLRVQVQDNIDKAPISFWSKLARRTLVEGRSLAVTHEEGGEDYYYVTGTRDVGGSAIGYAMSIKRSNDHVAVFEAWGPKEQMTQMSAAIRKSALSVDAR